MANPLRDKMRTPHRRAKAQKIAAPSGGTRKRRSIQSELPTGCAEVLSITGGADAHGGQASERFQLNQCWRATVLARQGLGELTETEKSELAGHGPRFPCESSHAAQPR